MQQQQEIIEDLKQKLSSQETEKFFIAEANRENLAKLDIYERNKQAKFSVVREGFKVEVLNQEELKEIRKNLKTIKVKQS